MPRKSLFCQSRLKVLIKEKGLLAVVRWSVTSPMVKISKITPNADLFNQIFANRTQEASGKIKLTAYLPKKPLIGQQTLATFNFELITKKAAVLGLEFTAPGQSADSNLVSWESQQDILSRVVPLKVEP